WCSTGLTNSVGLRQQETSDRSTQERSSDRLSAGAAGNRRSVCCRLWRLCFGQEHGSCLLLQVRSSLRISPRKQPLRKARTVSWHKCWEIAKYPTKGLRVTQSLAPGIGGGAIS